MTRAVTAWLLVLGSILIARTAETAKGARVVCYYTNWSIYRPGTAKFSPQNINPYLCTHLIYAFGGFTKENTLKPFDKYQDVEKGGYAKFTGLKTYNQNLKTLIAIGGWNEGSSRFSSLVASPDRRKEFVKNAVKFLRQNKFDGLDLDWEYPSFRDGGKPKDKGNYARLVQELREEFEKESQQTGRPRLLLTMAVPAGIEYIDKGYDIPKLNRYLDWMNILSYDYHSAFEPSVNHHSPLYSLEAASEYNFDKELNIDYTIQHYLEAGAEPDKLVLGIPTYGRSFTLVNPESTDIGAPADGPGDQGEATREKGYLAYYEICESLMKKSRRRRDTDSEEYEDEEEEEWTIIQPNPNAVGPYAYKGNQWVGYDDIDIVKKKAEYVAEKSLGGIMFWSIDNDDFRGKCHNKPYPLIEAAKAALYKSLGVTETIATKKPSGGKRPRPTKPSKVTSSDEKDISKNTVKTSKKDESSKSSGRRRQNLVRRASTTESTPNANTPAWDVNTPEPPTTPDPGSDFKCEEEGFFPHPRDCKKYFWCLESGPSNLGIVAHQFTCPSGLHFNKAADSCDFARNVLCNKKKPAVTSAPPLSTTEKASTTTEEASSTTSKLPSSLSNFFTTRRPSSRITAATSKTTLLFKLQSTTPKYIPVEEEYEDEETEVEDDIPATEEDPKVIKELVDLIKKFGGIEQLEKHLAGAVSNNVPGSQTTTPATISKSLYERVLSKTRPQSERAPPQQNSRGPQTAGLRLNDSTEKVSSRRERPQYTTINRQRPSTTERTSVEEESEEQEASEEIVNRPVSTSSRPGIPQYVNIRRGRPSTTETPESTARNALFEREPENNQDEDENRNRVQNIEYSTIGRIRQNFNNEATTSKYKTIQRTRSTTIASTVESNEKEASSNTPTESSASSSASTSSLSSSTEPKIPTTLPEVTTESVTLDERDNDVTDTNDVNEAVSPSFASENGVILNSGSSTVLNAQITTLSNTPKTTEESTPSIIPISYSTKVTISEEPFSPTQRSPPLFAKRTRPTTTIKPTQEQTEKATENKVSSDRYASIKRTRISASSTTPPPLPRARLRNEISTDSEKDLLDRNSDIGSVDVRNKIRQGIRKIRSTTPASQEVIDAAQPEGDYGSKRVVRPQLNRRRIVSKAVSSEETPSNSNGQSVISNGENGLLSRPRFVPRNSSPNSQPTFRSRKFLENPSTTNDNEESGNEFVPTEVSTARNVPNRRFRPTINDFNTDLSALNAADLTRERNGDSISARNAQVQRRFRPALSTTTEAARDYESNEDNTFSSPSDRQRAFGARGNRFSPTRSTPTEFELNTEASESSVYARGRNINVARFSPRPFTASTARSEDNDIKSIGLARLAAPVINVSEEDDAKVPLLKFPSAPSTTSSQQAINVTKVINSNILLGQSNNRSGILILRRPSKPISTTALPTTESKKEITDDLENIHVSETSIEENEQEEENEDINTLISDRPRKRIVVKKIRPSTASLDSSSPTEPSVSSTTEAVVSEKNDVETDDTNKEINQAGKGRKRIVLRRRPATSTTVSDAPTTEKYNGDLNEEKVEPEIKNSTSVNPTKVRKVIRRLKPVLTENGKARIIQTKEEELVEENLPGKSENITSTSSPIPQDEDSETEKIDLQTEQTTVSASTKGKQDRPSYKPIKRPLNVTASTETPTTASKNYSRKFNNAPYTTPVSPSERDQIALDKSRVEGGLPRKQIFNSKPFSRRPQVTTARTTTTDEDDYVDENEEEEEQEEEAPKLVLVKGPFYTRGPANGGRQVGSDDEPKVDENEEEENVEENEEPEEKKDDKNVNLRVPPNNRLPIRFNGPQRPPIVRGGVNTPEIRPSGFNRPVSIRPNGDPSSRFNRPVSFQPNRPNRFGTGSTTAPTESTTKVYQRKYNANRPVTEPPSNQEEINIEAVNAKHKQLFSNPKRFTTTTTSPLNTPEDGNTDATNEPYLDTTEMYDVTESETDIDLMSTTEESTTLNDINTESDVTVLDGLDIYNTTTFKPTTEAHQVFSLKNNSITKSNVETTTQGKLNVTSTTTTTEAAEKKYVEPSIKTSTQLDKLFEVSRLVEVSSTQEKHRLNRKNESRLIEKTGIVQEKKPRLDKIGEVSRFTFIKIVEGDIPIYLTNLSHEYPAPNPPFNPIRIDEGRNAKTLMNFSDSGKENLIASESVNSAYNHRNAFIDIIDAPAFSDSDRKQYITNKPSKKSEKSDRTSIESKFVPGAIDLEDLEDDVTSRTVVPSESSTLSLEGLFKTDNATETTASQATTTEGKLVTGNQPFVVYTAKPVKENDTEITKTNEEEAPSGRSVASFVKIQVLRPDEDKKVKDKEFLGVPAAVDVLLEKGNPTTVVPFKISILNQDEEKATSIANLDQVILNQTEINSTTPVPTTNSTTIANEVLTTVNQDDTTITTESYTTIMEETTTEIVTDTPTTDSTIVKIKPLNGSLSDLIKKRPKLTFPRRPQTQIKSTNITRLSIIPQANRNKATNTTTLPKNIPFTTPKYNRTNSYTSGKSRFSAIRSQNVPVDTRRPPQIGKAKTNSTSESTSASPETKKVTIKPLRVGLFRSTSFLPRRTTTPPSQTETATSSPAGNTTSRIRPAFFPKRSSSRFSPKPEGSTTTQSPKEDSHRFSSQSSVRRRPFARPQTVNGGVSNVTEAAPSTARPNRLFVRKYTRSGTDSKTTVATTTVKPLDRTTRRNFRIGIRKRPGSTVLPSSSTTEASATLPAVTNDDSGANQDQESHSTVQEVKEDVRQEAPKRKVSIKVQKRPLANRFKPNQIASDESQNDEKKEKIYSSVIKEDHTLVQQEKNYDTIKNEVKYDGDNADDVTADVAVAAHQLISAPLPTIPSYALDDHSDTENDAYQFTRDYLLASSGSPIVTHNDFVTTTEHVVRHRYTVPTKSRRISTTESPKFAYTPSQPVVRQRKPQYSTEFDKVQTVPKNYRKFVDYEYYDDDDTKFVGKASVQGKVIIHKTGVIECLDQGNFPHPESCKKFISCARMENGEVYGWAYTCPKGLSFDPVGGICNWSSGLGCKD